MLLIGPPLPLSLPAQVFEVGGGTSSLVQGSGGSITTHAASYDLTLGAGSLQGHLVEGARLVKATPQAKYILGDNQIAFQLPTDIFDASHFLLARGVGVQTTHNGTNTLAFAGATATAYSSPFFTGATTDNFTGVLFVQKKLGPRLQLFSDTIAASKPTGIAALAWSPQPKLDLAARIVGLRLVRHMESIISPRRPVESNTNHLLSARLRSGSFPLSYAILAHFTTVFRLCARINEALVWWMPHKSNFSGEASDAPSSCSA